MRASPSSRSPPPKMQFAPDPYRPAPFGSDGSGSSGFMSTSRAEFNERNLSGSRRVPFAPSPDRPTPYYNGDDALDKWQSTTSAQFAPRDSPARRTPADYNTGRPVPFAYDVGHDSPDRYQTTNSAQFQPERFDMSLARVQPTMTANYHGRPLPYASEADAPDKWSSNEHRQFIPRDLKEARPHEQVRHDQDYNVLSFEPIPSRSPKLDSFPRGRTAELGVMRPVGVDPIPASRRVFVYSAFGVKCVIGVKKSGDFI
mmetsp:Transcript_44149/g.102037  ORF Transcript_44149/g.102037 Transcript_44149/m.102037 type:complete len:257 (+) Transcript_44149:3-773(+)